MLKPQDFQVNEAWLGIKLTDTPLVVQEAEMNVFVLMDVASLYVIDQQVELVTKDLVPTVQAVEAMLMKAFAKAFRYPKKLYIPYEQIENNGFVTTAAKHNIPIENVKLTELDDVVSALKKGLHNIYTMGK